MTKFAAFNDQAIWGVGNSAEEARENAREWLDAPEQANTLEVAEMDAGLAAIVEERGGDVAFQLNRDGILIHLD